MRHSDLLACYRQKQEIREEDMSQLRTRIRRIDFSNFKALGSYSFSLGEVNILVGPNNSGKSTIIGALRTLDAALRFARTRPPTRVISA